MKVRRTTGGPRDGHRPEERDADQPGPGGPAARLVGPGRGGRPVHISTLVRAILAGELEALRFGRRWVTTVEAVQRWGESRARLAGAGPRAGSRTAPAEGGDETERRLRELGI